MFLELECFVNEVSVQNERRRRHVLKPWHKPSVSIVFLKYFAFFFVEVLERRREHIQSFSFFCSFRCQTKLCANVNF